ncbi:hypothetical protein [Corynebacterium aquatimens]|uniref:Uncharacterized protein n=1 Tax=Corynebacterium aquatimens TaxID=1190508 RepID=A0A931GRU8_9CORY|nr:hypothetical protein [Corynebacterium aquatimens]MBG6122368.1 hypothetical protein [Corynebacterium aquatimens]WJY65089.1 hypothetical protein CAQUA_01780 [Corynebacterium aquatimens]
MNLNDISVHLTNFADTWSGWGDVISSIVKLISEEWRDALRALIRAFDPETGLLNPANKDDLSAALKEPAQPNEEGKYEFNGLSSVKGSSK